MKLKLAALIILLLSGAVFFLNYHPATEKVDLLIINGRVVTMNPNMDEFSPGWIAVKRGVVVALDIGEGVPKGYTAGQVIDAEGEIVMPGLINTHSHAAMTKLVGIGQGESLQTWLKTMEAKEAAMTPTDVYEGTKEAIAKMIATGTTTFNDMYFFPTSAIRAVKESGIRAVIRIPITKENGQVKFDDSVVEKHPNLTFSLAPNPFLDFSPQELRQVSDYALSKDLLVHIHFEEDAESRKISLARYGLSSYEVLERSGLLRNKLLLAHAGDLTDEEIEKLAAYPNVAVSFNPLSEINLQTPLTPAKKLVEKKITVSIGTDGAPSSNLDMFSQIILAGEDFRNTPEAVIKMATLDGAKALGLEKRIGSLELGKKADIIIVKNTYTDAGAFGLVYNTKGEDVTRVIINGKVLK